MQEKVEKPLSKGFYVSQAFKSMHGLFIFLWLMKILDFASDVALNLKYYSQGGFEELPSEKECNGMDENNATIACYFHEMKSDKMLGIFCTLIFFITYFFSFIFVMLDEKAKHYFATSIGYCCWNCIWESKRNKCVNMLYYLIGFFIFLMNDIWTAIYGFWMEKFFEYWRPTGKKRPNTSGKKITLLSLYSIMN